MNNDEDTDSRGDHQIDHGAGSHTMTSPTATILIVDDEIQSRKLLEVLLRHEGYLTLSAANGEEALALIAQRAPPDLILLDERTADLLIANETLLVEKKRQEVLIKKLGESQSQLLQSEKMASIGQLAAGVAHEINNPVGFVNSNLGALKRYADDLLKLLAVYERVEGSLPDTDQQEIKLLKTKIDAEYLREDISNLLSESLDGLQRVTRIVQDLKDFSHVDESERQWANLESGLESTLRVVWNEIKYKAEVVKEYGNIPQIECFPSQLNQVFMNLLMNAVHAIEDRGQITIRTGHEQGTVWIEVEDTGKGIKPEHLGRIFEPFFTTKPVGKGTGLGLSLSYGIVNKHGGRIEVASEIGKGTKFTVYLPVDPKVD